jgi:hypothetical protein
MQGAAARMIPRCCGGLGPSRASLLLSEPPFLAARLHALPRARRTSCRYHCLVDTDAACRRLRLGESVRNCPRPFWPAGLPLRILRDTLVLGMVRERYAVIEERMVVISMCRCPMQERIVLRLSRSNVRRAGGPRAARPNPHPATRRTGTSLWRFARTGCLSIRASLVFLAAAERMPTFRTAQLRKPLQRIAAPVAYIWKLAPPHFGTNAPSRQTMQTPYSNGPSQ